MIIVKLMGGHSNQMFQYATGRRLAHKHSTILKIDITAYDNMSVNDTPRQYELDGYTLDAEIASAEDLALFERDTPPKNRVLRQFWKLTHNPIHKRLIYGGQKFLPEALMAPDNTYLDGWWQSEKYFADIRDIIIKDFSYKNPPSSANKKLLKQINDDPNSVSVHVRRGDYVNNPLTNVFHGVKELDYYNLALKELTKKVKNPNLYVISNDPEWCRQNLKFPYKTHFVDNNDDTTGGSEDMRLMRACKHNILANSSFSWWGAWLNENPKKIVIAPKQWFADTSVDTSDVVPEGWTQI